MDTGSYNMTTSSFTGISVIGNVVPTLALVCIGMFLAICFTVIIYHLYRQNKQFRIFAEKLFEDIYIRFRYGIYSSIVLGGLGLIYLGASSEDGKGILWIFSQGIAYLILIVGGITLLGGITKPIWLWFDRITEDKVSKGK
jgi:hypothetical protein